MSSGSAATSRPGGSAFPECRFVRQNGDELLRLSRPKPIYLTPQIKSQLMKITPTFSHPPSYHGLTEIAVPFLATTPEWEYASGTAVFIAPGIALAALHVIRDYYKKVVGKDLNKETSFAHDSLGFGVSAMQTVDKQRILWKASKMWAADPLDIAVLEFRQTQPPAFSRALPAPVRRLHGP